jgi:hypothetical protein
LLYPQHQMQKTQHQGDPRKQSAPLGLRPFSPIGIDTLRLVVGVVLQGFLLKSPVCFAERLPIRRQSHPYP